jgi:hypothetical protein
MRGGREPLEMLPSVRWSIEWPELERGRARTGHLELGKGGAEFGEVELDMLAEIPWLKSPA